MGYFTGKTVIITGAGRAVLSDGTCGSIGYGIAIAYMQGILKRSVEIFPDVAAALEA